YERIVTAAGTHGSDAGEPRMLVGTLLSHVSGHFTALMALFSGQAVVLVPGEGFEAGPTLDVMSREKVTELWPAQHDLRRPHTLQSCGKPGNGVEIELRDEHGVITEAGRIGELYIRSAMVTEGYWRDSERTRGLKDGEWARSGDLGYWDDEGYFYLVDRSRDIIVTGRTSDNVYSRLLDDYLCTLPGISQAAAVGVPDQELSEAVHVFLVPREGADLDLAAIRRQVVRELGDLYEPKAFSIMTSLPYTTVGKVDKKALRTAYVLAQAASSEASPVGSYA
ncbi:MAG TPA: fatty acid--CoA ligase family protein, partial [Streptosporangiaceae bacterium]